MTRAERNAAAAEAVRARRLREDARRGISVNLAEGIALSHKLMRFAGVARKPSQGGFNSAGERDA